MAAATTPVQGTTYNLYKSTAVGHLIDVQLQSADLNVAVDGSTTLSASLSILIDGAAVQAVPVTIDAQGNVTRTDVAMLGALGTIDPTALNAAIQPMVTAIQGIMAEMAAAAIDKELIRQTQAAPNQLVIVADNTQLATVKQVLGL